MPGVLVLRRHNDEMLPRLWVFGSGKTTLKQENSDMNNLRTINALATGLAEGSLKLLGQEY
jgi:hypothetical protein